MVTLTVVNCAGTLDDVLEAGFYACPAAPGPYSHQQKDFLGLYRDRSVQHLARIRAVVDVVNGHAATIYWSNLPAENAAHCAEALRVRPNWPYDNLALRIFLVTPWADTDHQKVSPGGMQQSKRYFNFDDLPGDVTVQQFAQHLSGIDWF